MQFFQSAISTSCCPSSGRRCDVCGSMERVVSGIPSEFTNTIVCESCYEILENELQLENITWAKVIRRRAQMLEKMADVVGSDRGRKQLQGKMTTRDVTTRIEDMRASACELREGLKESDNHRRLRVKVALSGVTMKFA